MHYCYERWPPHSVFQTENQVQGGGSVFGDTAWSQIQFHLVLCFSSFPTVTVNHQYLSSSSLTLCVCVGVVVPWQDLVQSGSEVAVSYCGSLRLIRSPRGLRWHLSSLSQEEDLSHGWCPSTPRKISCWFQRDLGTKKKNTTSFYEITELGSLQLPLSESNQSLKLHTDSNKTNCG